MDANTKYLMRDHYFPRDMRTPAFPIEYNQLAAYVGLRLTTMKVRQQSFPFDQLDSKFLFSC